MEQSNNHKLYYSIGEVSKIIGISTSLIRFWEKELGIRPQNKDERGNRKYKDIDINRLVFVRNMIKQKGYKLKGVKMMMTDISKVNYLNVLDSEYALLLNEIKSFLIYIRGLI